MDARRALGRAGEALVAERYRRDGYRVVETNFTCNAGEVDLVLRRGDTIVFCEVKTRRSAAFGAPSEAVDHTKRARLRRLAVAWLARAGVTPAEVRFDVAGVIVRGGRAEVERIEGAF
jgi:putative endonuclease